MSTGTITQSATQTATPTTSTPARSAVGGRWIGNAFGIGTQLLFLGTVVYLFQFLRFGAFYAHDYWMVTDPLLAIGFAIPHSLLLAPPIAAKVKRYVPAALMGCLHCTMTCLSLILMFQFWGRSSIELWHLSGIGEQMMLAGFYGSWVVLLYSLYLTGLGYQTGLTQWWYWMLRKPLPQRKFVVTGIYRWMRHPVYLSFLGLIWFTPVMTLDHALLTVVWTIYIYLGSVFKDRRLLKFIGEPYREYATRVSGLPVIGIGSLRRWKRV